MKQAMTGWQLHQLDYMQITCTSLQTDNRARTSLLIFNRSDAVPDAQPTVPKHLTEFPLLTDRLITEKKIIYFGASSHTKYNNRRSSGEGSNDHAKKAVLTPAV